MTQRNLLLSGVNFLHPPLKVLKQQAKTLHAARIRQRIVGKHPELADRLPATLWQKLGPEARMGADGEKQDTWLQAFALKLALRTLPTISRQHAWHPGAYPSPACPRCDTGEAETWEHVVRCPANAADARQRVREKAERAATGAVEAANASREEEEPPRPRWWLGNSHSIANQPPSHQLKPLRQAGRGANHPAM